ncbi:MAG: CRTAC1 family protein, partial [Acidobacteriota bacterium]|nr:CRTAC1 family protein [Acidobacteriota bacterium]
MNKARLFAAVLFVALLASPIVYKRVLAHRQSATAANNQEAASLANYGFYLHESAAASGIHFKHQAPKLDSRLDHIMPQIASMGAAVSVVDFDGDGWDDFYVTNSGEGSHNALYRNMH